MFCCIVQYTLLVLLKQVFISKNGLKSLLRQGLSEPDFYGDLVYKLKKIVGSNNFSAQFIKIISHYKKMAITLMYCTDCMLGGQPNHGWQLCFPL